MPRQSRLGLAEKVEGLRAEAEQLEAWLSRVDDAGAENDAPERVIERVRADYEQRLQAAEEALLGERGSIQEAFNDAVARRDRARELFEEARAALAEAQIRHAVGELDQEGWDQARQQQEMAIDAHGTDLEVAEGEADELGALLAKVDLTARKVAGREGGGATELADAPDPDRDDWLEEHAGDPAPDEDDPVGAQSDHSADDGHHVDEEEPDDPVFDEPAPGEAEAGFDAEQSYEEDSPAAEGALDSSAERVVEDGGAEAGDEGEGAGEEEQGAETDHLSFLESLSFKQGPNDDGSALDAFGGPGRKKE